MENVQKKLDAYIETVRQSGERKKLLIHACCAPCSSYVLEYLSAFFDLTLLFYNPNMDTLTEYEKRAEELKRLIREMNLTDKVSLRVLPYDHEAFERIAEGLEDAPERGARCLKCYELRLRKAAEILAREKEEFESFSTTLTLSPLKNAEALNRIGEELSEEYGVPYLPTDFKKKNGYKRSIELSRIYDLYRQNYCGCKYSKRGKES